MFRGGCDGCSLAETPLAQPFWLPTRSWPPAVLSIDLTAFGPSLHPITAKVRSSQVRRILRLTQRLGGLAKDAEGTKSPQRVM